MESPKKNSESLLPKINQKLAVRTLLLVIVVGAMIYGFEWFLGVKGDPGGLLKSDTSGWIGAIEYLPEGRQAVLISPDGAVHKDKGYVAHENDEDIVWSPQGNFLYFVSNRKENNFNLYRWAPSSESPAEQRTTGTRSRGNPTFNVQSTNVADRTAKALITCGGTVQQFDPTNQSTEQVLPPVGREISESQEGGDHSGGQEGAFEGTYGNLGDSFRLAKWCGGGKYIAAIMRRELGEVLVIQAMDPVNGRLPTPRALTAGEHIDFAVNPKNGNIVYSVQRFQWPEAPPLDKNGKPMPKPFTNAVVVFDFDAGQGEIMVQDNKYAFGAPAIKPDGSVFAVIAGPLTDAGLDSKGLITYPTSNDKGFKQVRVSGEIHEPSWSPDGLHLVYALRQASGKRSIIDRRVDDNTTRDITGDAGDFGFPIFSPQISSGP